MSSLIATSTLEVRGASGSTLWVEDGMVGIGTTAPNLRFGEKLDIAASADYSGMGISTWSTTAAHMGLLEFNRSKRATIGTQTIVASGDALGAIGFRGSDGTNFQTAASITGEVDGTPGASDMPGRLIFKTTADGAAVGTERMRIDSGGNVGIRTTTRNLWIDGKYLWMACTCEPTTSSDYHQHAG